MITLSKALVRNRIGQVVWTTVALAMTLGQLPFWLVLAIPSRWRQHPRWTYRQAISNRLLRAFIYHWSLMEIPTLIQLKPAAEKDRFVILEPAEKHVYRGVLASKKVQPAAVGATWFPKRYTKPEDGKKIVLYVHGGAFVMGEGRSFDAGFPCITLATNLNAHVLSISYRLAGNPGCRFPAALQDTVTAYHFLLHQQQVPAHRLVVVGDSAGANLVIALLRYISDTDGLLAPPAAALLFSPWVDLASARDPARVDRYHNYPTDYLPGNFTAWGAHAYAPPAMDPAEPYLSPLGHPFRSATPVFICVGGLETLYDQGLDFARQMAEKTEAGEDIKIHIEPDATHAFLNVGNLTGFEDAAGKAVRVARDWMAESIERK
ncbi:hypothetical protein MMC30_004182 [Trapelia coarctata]|nr:hypothetical protein [Trapelia coarctata]